MGIALIVLAAVVVILLGSGAFFACKLVYPHRFTVEETYNTELEKGGFVREEYEAWEREEVRIQSPHGYSLYGLWFPLPGAKRSVILSHGITYTLNGCIKYMNIFRRLGFNMFTYDLRHHGRSGGRSATFGLFEKDDLRAVMDWVVERTGEGGLTGTQGESMGAAISLQHAAIDPRVAFVIEDCGYSDLSDLVTFRLKEDFHLPPFPMVPLASLMSGLLTGMRFGQVSPVGEVGKITAPVLFIHGAEDGFIPARMGQAMYDAKVKGARSLYMAPGAAHAEAYWSNPAEYERRVRAFLIENHFIPATKEP